MYKVLDCNSQRDGEKLVHSGNVFHEAIEKKADYCHVYRDGEPVYDLEKIDNNYTIRHSKGAQDNGFSEIFFDFDHYDEKDDRTINLSLIRRFQVMEIEELTEYSIVIAKIAAEKLNMQVFVTDPRIRLFMDDPANIRIVEELPGRPDRSLSGGRQEEPFGAPVQRTVLSAGPCGREGSLQSEILPDRI